VTVGGTIFADYVERCRHISQSPYRYLVFHAAGGDRLTGSHPDPTPLWQLRRRALEQDGIGLVVQRRPTFAVVVPHANVPDQSGLHEAVACVVHNIRVAERAHRPAKFSAPQPPRIERG
jgi:hypothetical protein